MEFFESVINEINLTLSDYTSTGFNCSLVKAWEDIGYNQVILQRDTAFELSGTGFNLVTSCDIEDEIVVIGENLDKIKGDCKFARISLVQIEADEDEQKLYNLIRKIEYVKYHYFPDGYMIRTSSRSHKEAARVSKKALKNGINFENIGSLLIKKYKEIPLVKGVKVLFITEPSIDYKKIETLAEKCNKITETLNHIMNSVKFDCDTCNLKPICDEVEGMKQLHFKNASEKGM